jgi:hypothetical protein
MLYAGAIMQAIEAMTPANGLVALLRIPTETVLFLIAYWLVRAGGIERYLENLETVAALNPRVSAGVGLAKVVQSLWANLPELVKNSRTEAK